MDTGSRLAASCALLFLVGFGPALGEEADDAAVPFVRLVELIDAALAHAADTLNEDDIARIKSAELSVAVEVSKEAETGFKLFFFNLSGGAKQSTVSTISLSYKDVSAEQQYPTSADYTVISNAIVNAAKAARAAPVLAKLPLDAYKVELRFATEYVGEGKFEIVFGVGSVAGGASISQEQTNSLALEFAPPGG
ncbi:hypothetical protein [Paracoccus zhejiangensis]|uniref:hypothetical protein n=1 Tax=Paracoccus zhejiangensis TaxID=1077935 RepID=UPI00130013DF|nr:hypothetical protein [Paracoccus zhejiangensis]